MRTACTNKLRTDPPGDIEIASEKEIRYKRSVRDRRETGRGRERLCRERRDVCKNLFSDKPRR